MPVQLSEKVQPDENAVEKADEALEKLRIFDLHCDTLDRLALRDSSVYPGFAKQNTSEGISPARMSSLFNNDAHVSLARMSNYAWCQCFAVFVPDVLFGEEAWRLYEQVTGFFSEQCEAHAQEVVAIRDFVEMSPALTAGKCAAILTVEGLSFLTDSLAPLDRLERDGVRMVTLTWNAQNAVASGKQTHAGFSVFGRKVVRELEARRIIVDVSHLNDEGFAELLDFSQRPFVASHSNSCAVCDHPRNLTDDQFRAISSQGGLVGLNFCNNFLISEKRDPTPEDVLRHIEHWLALGGEHAIALGSDYDGCDVPSWLRPADRLLVLYEETMREFGEDIAKRLFFDNAFDFFVRNARV